MGVYYFPCNFVYWTNVKNHEKYKKVLMAKLHNEKHKFDGVKNGLNNGTTSHDSEEPFVTERDIIEEVVWKSLDEALDEMNSRNNFDKILLNDSFLNSNWYTEYKSNGSITIHNHISDPKFRNGKRYKPTFSLIYILNDDNEKNQTQFMIPSNCSISTTEYDELRFNTSEVDEIKEGSVLVFPSSLYHTVGHVSKPGRIVIAFNIYSSFKI